MIILDTNVVSEPLRPQPKRSVVEWLDAQSIETLYLTSITLAEIRLGIAVLPDGRRKKVLHQRFERDVVPAFGDRILSFDAQASTHYAQLRASARTRGRALGDFDALIASIAASHRFIVATRDTSPFEVVDIPVLDPFTYME